MRILQISAIALTLAACSAHNTPKTDSFTTVEARPASARVFLDANGSFYPTGWRTKIRETKVQDAHSLLNATYKEPSLRTWLASEEERQLSELRALVAGKKRVFIVTHGFNMSEDDAEAAFTEVERRLALGKDDALIRLHWDGLIGEGLSAGSIWFKAAGYSQMAGLRGLRRILNVMENQDVILISHSRGASVFLSALSNPPFAYEFKKDTLKLDFAQNDPEFLRPAPLVERGNRIQMVLLAPAVGYPDFWDPSCEPTRPGEKICKDPQINPASSRRCSEYRTFSPQLKAIRYTVNRGDSTLQKMTGNLARYFNATDLGFNAAVGESLSQCYDFPLVPYVLKEPHPHGYLLYVNDPELRDMLRDSEASPQQLQSSPQE